MKLIRILTITLHILILFPLFASANQYRELCDKLDDLLGKREQYFAQRWDEIQKQEALLGQQDKPQDIFDISYNIFNLSRSYKFDVAYKYASAALAVAQEIGDKDLECRARAAVISSLTSGGLFTEAASMVSSTNLVGVSDEVRREFYYNVVRYYSDQIDYQNQAGIKENYTFELRENADSIIALSKEKDYYYTYAVSYSESSRGEYQKSIDVLNEFYGSSMCSQHHNSIITFLLGNAYFAIGNSDSGYKYMLLSVEHDIKAAARENRSIKTMAEHLFSDGQIEMADKMINIAFEDAKFYNARHRNLEINTLLPVINEQIITTVSRQRNMVYGFSIVVSMLAIIALIFGILAHKRAKVIQQSKQIIQDHLEQLSLMNNKLLESNNIKEHYIVESLYKKKEHLRQMEQLLHKVDIKIKNKLYDDLRYIYKEFNVKREREHFFSDFDRAFLDLFPNFIEEYNLLFMPEDRINIQESVNLPAELRIFALMRLGIVDNEQISQFLDLSINTIYTYKTKVKNKSIVPKDEFEKRILQIKLSIGNPSI